MFPRFDLCKEPFFLEGLFNIFNLATIKKETYSTLKNLFSRNMKKFKMEMVVALSTLIAWIILGTVSFHHLEPWSWIESFYFSVATVTTVGYGDLAPTTDMSRLFAAFYILIGVSIGLATLGLFGAEMIKKRQKKYLEKISKNA